MHKRYALTTSALAVINYELRALPHIRNSALAPPRFSPKKFHSASPPHQPQQQFINQPSRPNALPL
ncbi:MAG: hypothetical protein LBQ31_07155 [Bacteroidales bacterium]|nr:hypothetical protein [Bacteroidales bacterium]